MKNPLTRQAITKARADLPMIIEHWQEIDQRLREINGLTNTRMKMKLDSSLGTSLQFSLDWQANQDRANAAAQKLYFDFPEIAGLVFTASLAPNERKWLYEKLGLLVEEMVYISRLAFWLHIPIIADAIKAIAPSSERSYDFGTRSGLIRELNMGYLKPYQHALVQHLAAWATPEKIGEVVDPISMIFPNQTKSRVEMWQNLLFPYLANNTTREMARVLRYLMKLDKPTLASQQVDGGAVIVSEIGMEPKTQAVWVLILVLKENASFPKFERAYKNVPEVNIICPFPMELGEDVRQVFSMFSRHLYGQPEPNLFGMEKVEALLKDDRLVGPAYTLPRLDKTLVLQQLGELHNQMLSGHRRTTDSLARTFYQPGIETRFSLESILSPDNAETPRVIIRGQSGWPWLGLQNFLVEQLAQDKNGRFPLSGKYPMPISLPEYAMCLENNESLEPESFYQRAFQETCQADLDPSFVEFNLYMGRFLILLSGLEDIPEIQLGVVKRRLVSFLQRFPENPVMVFETQKQDPLLTGVFRFFEFRPPPLITKAKNLADIIGAQELEPHLKLLRFEWKNKAELKDAINHFGINMDARIRELSAPAFQQELSREQRFRALMTLFAHRSYVLAMYDRMSEISPGFLSSNTMAPLEMVVVDWDYAVLTGSFKPFPLFDQYDAYLAQLLITNCVKGHLQIINRVRSMANAELAKVFGDAEHGSTWFYDWLRPSKLVIEPREEQFGDPSRNAIRDILTQNIQSRTYPGLEVAANTFVPTGLSYRRGSLSQVTVSKDRLIHFILNIDQHKAPAFLLGGPGTGKTTWLHQLALMLLGLKEYLPIFISMQDIDPSVDCETALLRYMERYPSSINLPEGIKPVFLMDDFDEIPGYSPQVCKQWLETLTNLHKPLGRFEGVPFICTGKEIFALPRDAHCFYPKGFNKEDTEGWARQWNEMGDRQLDVKPFVEEALSTNGTPMELLLLAAWPIIALPKGKDGKLDIFDPFVDRFRDDPSKLGGKESENLPGVQALRPQQFIQEAGLARQLGYTKVDLPGSQWGKKRATEIEFFGYKINGKQWRFRHRIFADYFAAELIASRIYAAADEKGESLAEIWCEFIGPTIIGEQTYCFLSQKIADWEDTLRLQLTELYKRFDEELDWPAILRAAERHKIKPSLAYAHFGATLFLFACMLSERQQKQEKPFTFDPEALAPGSWWRTYAILDRHLDLAELAPRVFKHLCISNLSTAGGRAVNRCFDHLQILSFAEDSPDLTGSSFRAARLPRKGLQYADLSQAILDGAYLDSVNLTGANLTDASLEGVTARNTDFSAAILSKANLRNADLGHAQFTRANLQASSLQYANLESADLTDADLTNAQLVHANLTGTLFQE